MSDDSRIGVSAGVSAGNYYTDWYASVFLAHPPLNLTVTYEGSFTVSRTQTLYVWNWSTSAWVQVNSATVSTTDVTKTWSTGSPASYVGPSREVRFRVKGDNRASTYTSRGDYMAFDYDYTAGTVTSPTHEAVVVASAIPVDDSPLARWLGCSTIRTPTMISRSRAPRAASCHLPAVSSARRRRPCSSGSRRHASWAARGSSGP